MTSNRNPPCDDNWSGGRIDLYRNEKLIFNFEPNFENSQTCIPFDQIDENNDTFKLQIVGNDVVSLND